MDPIHSEEKEQFKKLFQYDGIEHFEDKFRILEVFLQTEQHVTVNELVQILETHGMAFPPDFVRDTLNFMCRYGFAQKKCFEGDRVRYEHLHLGDHHDHMVCTKCGKIIEFRNEQLERLLVSVTARCGFHMVQHKLEGYGICSECLDKQTELMPLILIKSGERVVVRKFTGGPGGRMRLMTMGLRIGDIVEVITNMGGGQLVIAVDCKRFVLGQGLARKIMAEPLS